MGTASYVIRGGVEGRERLRLVSAVHGPTTRDLLATVGIPAGSICLDVGCGGGDVTFDLARMTGPTGRVIGVDLDETKLELARSESAQHGLTNVTFEARDVTAWEPDGLFDFVYARLLLTHLRDPAAVVRAMRRHIKPGGAMIVEDLDIRGCFSEPDSRAAGRFIEYYTKAVQRRGADPHIGPRLPSLLRDAGLENVQMKLTQPVALVGGVKLLMCATLESIADTVLADGLASEAELRATIDELYTFARDPHTIMGGPRVFQVWGRNAA